MGEVIRCDFRARREAQEAPRDVDLELLQELPGLITEFGAASALARIEVALGEAGIEFKAASSWRIVNDVVQCERGGEVV